ncbi:DUF3303 family protein [Streptomyces sp. URMC 123]|uniref:DUF3303 family protein n=1 Tax=Streptomyces sp. URMC 123 TaxID=3423403 RepID=UPI003F1BB44C
MRMLLKAHIPSDAGTEAIRNGTMPKTMESVLSALRPEAAYFYPENGRRTAFLVFDMEDSSDMPSVCEPFFMELDAEISIQPVMNVEDLQKGLGELMGGR